MGKLLLFSLLTLASLRSAATEKGEEKFIKEGGSVDLDLRPVPAEKLTIIQWKFKDSILAEWVEGVVNLTHNRPNIKLDINTGRLSMEKMTKAEEGVYSVEVNNIVQQVTYLVVVIKDVPKPEIWVAPLACSHDSILCTLTCEGDTTGAEPITYSWKTDDGGWESKKAMTITKKEDGKVKTFTCKMKNPVSEKESDPLPNILFTPDVPDPAPNAGLIVGIIAALAAIGIGGGTFWAWKKDKLPCWKRNIEPAVAAENGNGPPSTDGANAVLLNDISTSNTSPDAKPGSQAEPPNPPHEKEPVSKNESAESEDPPKPTLEEKLVIEKAPGEGDAAV